MRPETALNARVVGKTWQAIASVWRVAARACRKPRYSASGRLSVAPVLLENYPEQIFRSKIASPCGIRGREAVTTLVTGLW